MKFYQGENIAVLRKMASCDQIANVERQRKYIERFRNAQKEKIKWKVILENDVYELIDTQSQIIGCAKELVLFPLLTTVASCMGPGTIIQVNPNWSEKMILWCLIGARRGERKSSAIRTMKVAAKKLEKEIDALHKANTIDTDKSENESFESKFVIDETCISNIKEILDKKRLLETGPPSILALMDDFANVMKKYETFSNLCKIEDISHMYEGSQSDQNEGIGNKSDSFDAFINFSAMVQAVELPKLLDLADDQCLMDKILLICAPENVSCRFQNTSNLQTSPTLQSVLSSVRNFHHVQDVAYSFSSDAELALNSGLQEFHNMKLKYAFDERCWGASNKANSHVVRLCAVFTALKNGLAMANKSSFLPSRIIDEDTVKRVLILVRTLLRQKFSLMSNPVDIGGYNLVTSHEMEFEETIDSVNNVSTSCQERIDDVIEINDESEERQRHMDDVAHLQNEKLRITDVRTEANSDMMIFREGYTDVVQMPKQEVDVYHEQQMVNEQPVNYTTTGGSVTIDFSNSHAIPSEIHQYGHHSFSDVKPVFENSDNGQFDSRDIKPRFIPNFDLKTKFTFPGQRMKPKPRPKQMFVNRAMGHLKDKRNFVMPKAKKVVKDDIYKMDEETFIVQCGSKIKKLLLTKGLVVTASYACQYRLFPPVPVDQRSNSPRTTHPAWAAAKFFEKLGELGVGSMLLFRGHSVKFKKRRLEEMDDRGRSILRRVNITDEEYERSCPQNTDSIGIGQYQYEFTL